MSPFKGDKKKAEDEKPVESIESKERTYEEIQRNALSGTKNIFSTFFTEFNVLREVLDRIEKTTTQKINDIEQSRVIDNNDLRVYLKEQVETLKKSLRESHEDMTSKIEDLKAEMYKTRDDLYKTIEKTKTASVEEAVAIVNLGYNEALKDAKK